MILLGIETATELVGVCVADAAGSRAGVWATGRRRHAETLAPAVAFVLDQAGVALSELTAVAVDVGPGLFTGLRVGVTTAKGLAQGLGIGVVGIGSLEVLARAAFDAGHEGTAVAVVDARRGEVFAARYRRPHDGEPMELLGPPRVLRPEDLAAELAAEPAGEPAGPSGPVLAIGDGALRYRDTLRAVRGVVVAGPSLAAPPPQVLVTLASEHLAAGGPVEDPALVVPEYLRGPDTRINWQQRTARAGPDGRPRAGPDGRPRAGPDGRPRAGPDGRPRAGPDGRPRR